MEPKESPDLPQGAPANPGQKIWPVATFTFTYLGGAAFACVTKGNTEFLLYVGVVLVMLCLMWVVHRRIGLSPGALWCLSLWGFIHMAGGLITVPQGWPVEGESRVLYTLWLIPGVLKYDHPVHAYGFGVATWVCWQGLRGAISETPKSVTPTFGLMVLCAAGGLGFGALNEVVEFAVTLRIPETNVGGYVNTGWDLVANTVGATVAVTLIWLSGRRAARG